MDNFRRRFGTKENTNFASEYFYIEAVNSFTLEISSEFSRSFDSIEFYYSINNGPWIQLTRDDEGYIGLLLIGDIVRFKGRLFYDENNDIYKVGSYSGRLQFFLGLNSTNDSSINVGGNLLSLIYCDNFKERDDLPTNMINSVLSGGSFYNFLACSGNSRYNVYIKSAKNLVLPSLNLDSGCFSALFQYQDQMYEVCDIEVSQLIGCSSMFGYCSSLENIIINTPTIDNSYRMFYGCTNLENAVLNIQTISNNYAMFQGCRKLNDVTCTATSFSNCEYWMDSVSSTGTFRKLASTVYDGGLYDLNGQNSIPSGWTVVNI